MCCPSGKKLSDIAQKGITVRTTIDCMIATYCIQAGYQLLQKDRDFQAFKEHFGLRLLDPASRSS